MEVDKQTVIEDPIEVETPTGNDDQTGNENPTDVDDPTEVEIPKDDENPVDIPDSPLVGFIWKLDGIVETETGNLTVLEPSDCVDCYSLIFITDSTTSCVATFFSKFQFYSVNYEKGYIYFDGVKQFTDETDDGDFWWDFFPTTCPFFLQEDELRLHVTNQQYLLFHKRMVCDVEKPLKDLPWLRELVKRYEKDGDIQNIYKCTYYDTDGIYDGFYINPRTYCIPEIAVLYTCDGVELDKMEVSGSYYIDEKDDFHKKWNIKAKLQIWLDIY